MFIFADLRHRVEVTSSSESPMSGDVFTLLCTVHSDLPATVTWLGPMQTTTDQTVFAVAETFVDGDLSVTRSNITFDPLQLSHGGLYTCQSVVNITSSRNNVSQILPLTLPSMFTMEQFCFTMLLFCVLSELIAILSLGGSLSIVPPPFTSASRITQGEIRVGSVQTMKCRVTIGKMDIPVRLTLSWRFSNATLNQSVTELPVSNKASSYYLDHVVDPFNYTETGVYSCMAHVEAADEATAVFVKSAASFSTLTLTVSDGMSSQFIFHSYTFCSYHIHSF